MSDALGGLGFDGGDGFDDEISIDDSLSVQEKVERYLGSEQILHRLYVMRKLGDFATQLGCRETESYLLPIIESLQSDSEPVIRQVLAEQVPSLAQFFADEGVKEALVERLLPVVTQLVIDRNLQVRLSATEALIAVISTVEISMLQARVLEVVRQLSEQQDSDDEYRVEAMRLIHHLSPLVSREVVSEHFLPIVKSLSKDTFRVRKALAGYIGSVSVALGHDMMLEHLWPIFQTLCTDEVWGVRRACAESIVVVSEVMGKSDADRLLTPVFVRLLEDSSRWVRSGAYAFLGRFIATLDGDDVRQLLQFFTQMVTVSRSAHGDSEIVTYCAFNFPGVLHTIGAARWPEVVSTFVALTKDLQWQVRKPLAFSLHVIAEILGPEAAREHLLGTFERFLRDLDEVKIGVIRHFADFLACLPPAARAPFVREATDLGNDPNWRFRKTIAKQLARLAALYEPAVVAESVLPMLHRLLTDGVASVRSASFVSTAQIIALLRDAAMPQFDAFMEGLLAMAEAKSYVPRQTLASVAVATIEAVPPDYFTACMLEPLIRLSDDRVPNVRMVAAAGVRLLATRDPFASMTGVHDAQRRLIDDNDRDVVDFVQSARSNPLRQSVQELEPLMMLQSQLPNEETK